MTRPNNWMEESYMNIKEDNRPYMDPYLKDMINKSFVIFERLKRGQKKVYFTGNWQSASICHYHDFTNHDPITLLIPEGPL